MNIKASVFTVQNSYVRQNHVCTKRVDAGSFVSRIAPSATQSIKKRMESNKNKQKKSALLSSKDVHSISNLDLIQVPQRISTISVGISRGTETSFKGQVVHSCMKKHNMGTNTEFFGQNSFLSSKDFDTNGTYTQMKKERKIDRVLKLLSQVIVGNLSRKTTPTSEVLIPMGLLVEIELALSYASENLLLTK